MADEGWLSGRTALVTRAGNVRSAYLMGRAFLPAMYQRGGGDVITIASVTGKRPLARRTPYAASKMAVLGLTRNFTAEAVGLIAPP